MVPKLTLAGVTSVLRPLMSQLPLHCAQHKCYFMLFWKMKIYAWLWGKYTRPQHLSKLDFFGEMCKWETHIHCPTISSGILPVNCYKFCSLSNQKRAVPLIRKRCQSMNNKIWFKSELKGVLENFKQQQQKMLRYSYRRTFDAWKMCRREHLRRVQTAKFKSYSKLF